MPSFYINGVQIHGHGGPNITIKSERKVLRALVEAITAATKTEIDTKCYCELCVTVVRVRSLCPKDPLGPLHASIYNDEDFDFAGYRAVKLC
jgi:hypothetical protein